MTFFAAIKRSVSLFQGLSTVQISYSKFENESYIIKLSLKGKVNSGGYTETGSFKRFISSAVH